MDNTESDKEILVSEIIDLKEITFETLSYFNFMNMTFRKKDFKNNMDNFIIKFYNLKTMFYDNSNNIVKNDEYYDICQKIVLIENIINNFNNNPNFEYNYGICLNLFLICDSMMHVSFLLVYNDV